MYSFFLLCLSIQVNYGISQVHDAEEAESSRNIALRGKCTDRNCICAEIPHYKGVDCKADYGSELPLLYFKNFSYLPGRLFQRLLIHSVYLRDPDASVAENVFEGIIGLRKFLVEHSRIQVVPDFRIVKDSITMVQIESSHLTSLEGKHLQNLTFVWFLSFFNNSIRFIDPDVFWGTYNVRCLDLSYNKLTSIPPKLLYPMRRLETFSANHNNLLSVDYLFSVTSPSTFAKDEFTGLASLQYLYLQHNQIQSLGTLQKLEKLLVLNIAQNDIQLIKPHQLPNSLKIIYLAENPFKCDCNLKPFLNFLKARQEEDVLEADTNMCLWSDIGSSPRKQSNCPSVCSCRCTEYGDDVFIFVDCRSRNLLDVPQFLSNNLTQQEDNGTISDHQRQLLIQEDMGSPFLLEDSFQGINLENNSLKLLDADKLPPNLFQLYLSNNELRWLPDAILDSQLNLKQVSLSGNPWNCSCDALKFKNWLKSNMNIILDIDNVRCRVSDKEDPKLNGSVLWMIPDLDLCSTTQSLLFIFFVCLGILIITIFCLSSTFLYLKYKLNLKVFLYSHGFTSLKEEDIDYDKVFDAFVSFSHEDDEFVVREVISEKICPETSTINPPVNATTTNRECGSEEDEGDVEITEVRRSNWIPTIDWENLPLGESNPFIPDEIDEMNIDLILEGTLRNLDSLKLLRKPCDSDLCDSERESANEPRPRFPKRNVPKVCYREEDVSSDDDYIFCDDCGEQYEGSCPKHGPLNFVKDKKAPPGPRHAWSTCPDYLSVCRSGIRGAGLGIWTETDLNKGYVFGPYKGKIVKSRKEAKDSGYSWEIRRSGKVLHYVEGVDTSVSNWMRFVNCAVCEERQNLIAFQYHGQILYRVYKEVKAYTELLVWYGDEFGEELGIVRKEETLLLKGVIKNSQYDRGVAPSSSTRKRSSSETFPEQLKRMSRKPTVSQAFNSSHVPGDVNIYHLSQQSKYRKLVRRRISTENDASEKLRFAKRDGMDCVAEDNLVLSDQNKQVSTTAKNRVLRKCHACTHCDYKTTVTTNIRRHIAVHEGIRRYKCQLCDYRASLANHLRRHVDAVHEGKKPYECQHCDYRASRANILRQHVNAVHEGKKPHPCPHCDYRAAQPGSVRMHVRAVHERMKPYGCRICDYRAARNSNVRRHMKAVHGVKESTVVTKM